MWSKPRLWTGFFGNRLPLYDSRTAQRQAQLPQIYQFGGGKAASFTGLPLQKIEEITTKNAKTLFKKIK